MIKGVILDFDGTIVDTVDAIAEAVVKSAEKLGVKLKKEEVKPHIGMGGDHLLRKFFGDDLELIEKMKKLWAKSSEKYMDLKSVRLFPNAKKFLTELRRRGYKIGIGSSSLKRHIEKILGHFKLEELVDCYVSGEEIERGKPEPDIFIKVTEILGLKPEECIVVGDTEYDIIAGKKMGSRTVLVIHDPTKVYDGEKPDFIVHDLLEILEIIDELRGDIK
ncbi:MAG: HAD family hydrolase [Candidatus Asgardarchaeia archaeon]